MRRFRRRPGRPRFPGHRRRLPFRPSGSAPSRGRELNNSEPSAISPPPPIAPLDTPIKPFRPPPMPSPPVCVLEAIIDGNAGAFSNSSLTASSGASRWMKSPIRATALRATSGVKSAAVATRAIRFSISRSLAARNEAGGRRLSHRSRRRNQARSKHVTSSASRREMATALARLVVRPDADLARRSDGQWPLFTAPHHRQAMILSHM